MKKPRIPWAQILLESGFVVFGLVLALSANNWLENRHNAERADRALAGLVDELAVNREAVLAAIDYHAEVLGRLYSFEQSAAPGELPSEVFARGYIRVAETPSHAWDAATGSGTLELLPYETVLLASKIYQAQSRYQQSATWIGNEIYRRLFDGGHRSIIEQWRNMREILHAVVFRECQLAGAYAEYLPELADRTSGETAGPGALAVELPESCRRMQPP